jgi:hypothetical protein
MLVNIFLIIKKMREGEELKAARHASAAATRDDTWWLLVLFPTITFIINIDSLEPYKPQIYRKAVSGGDVK